jgi:osmoprotectant transport system ATP-binding protein
MLELDGVRKVYAGGQIALHEVSLRVDAGTTLALLGPSGCGKTTLLKLINRLLEPTAGRIIIDSEDSATLDPVLLRRRIGYVVQEAGLFPHLTAADNAAVVPDLLGWPAPRRRERVRELFALLGLDHAQIADRFPAQLSGGQRQRVGLARALAVDPSILLMDEPFGALDPLIRARLQDEFRDLQARLAKTVVLVTHDVDEAFRLADAVAVLDAGRVVQIGTPGEIRRTPVSPFVAAFVARREALAT